MPESIHNTTETIANFDYIICGAGAAGCVLANRLSENPAYKVLLIEAGPSDKSWLVTMPRGFGKLLLNEKRARFFQTGPDNGAKPNGEVWSRGRMLGGSSSINGMMYFHGHPEDYDEWVKLGNPGWGWDEIGPIFKTFENHALGPGINRGVGGPVNVTVNTEPSPLMDALIHTGGEMGLETSEDLNESTEERIGYSTFNMGGGKRSGASQAFLHPVIKRPNLTVVTDTLVTKVMIEGGRAVGVNCSHEGRSLIYKTEGEVILSGGALQSPQLLELSGIGAGARLQDLGIDVIQDRPGVGENLREHCLIIMQRRLLKNWSDNLKLSGWRQVLNGARYYLNRSGPLSYAGFDMSAFVKCHPASIRPDVHMIASKTSMDLQSWDGWTKGPTMEKLPGMQLMGYVSNPLSQGSVHIASPDPAAAPTIRANFLTHDHDKARSIAMYRYMRQFLDHDSLVGVVGEETIPGRQVETDDQIIEAFDTYSGPGYHACGSAKMGNDPMAVVNHKLRVHGVSGLRVVDISIFPTITSANTNGPAMATAWRGADLIIEDRNS